jgi:hypothetical protein
VEIDFGDNNTTLYKDIADIAGNITITVYKGVEIDERQKLATIDALVQRQVVPSDGAELKVSNCGHAEVENVDLIVDNYEQ